MLMNAAPLPHIYIDDNDLGIKYIEEQTVLCENLTDDVHVIKVIRVNSEVRGIISLTGISGVEEYLPSDPKPTLKFEFYGDSITAGYGVNVDGSEDTISNEDGTVTYAYKTVEHFNAQASYLCYSGVSVSLPYWVEWIVPDRFKGYSYSTKLDEWDFTKFIPDIVVINLGTNDSGKISPNDGSSELFKDRYYKFLVDLRKKYKDASIICSYGMMGVEPNILKGIKEAVELMNDSKIYALEFVPVNCEALYGHPSKMGHIDGANQLIKFIESII